MVLKAGQPGHTYGDLLDKLCSSMAALHQGPGPGGEVTVGLHTENVHLDALARP